MTCPIATVATGPYLALLPGFIHALRLQYPRLDVFILTTAADLDEAHLLLESLGCSSHTHLISADGPPGLPSDPASLACSLKLRLWSHLPQALDAAVFIDADSIVIGDVLEALQGQESTTKPLALARDSYVGYKELMKQDFAVLGSAWQPQFDCSGRRLYCNTGLIWTSRADADFFEEVIERWRAFSGRLGASPPLWDQGLLNYCLDLGTCHRRWSDVTLLDERFNALKEYEVQIDLDNGAITLDGQPVLLLHFNGGTTLEKYARRARALSALSWPSNL